VSVEEGVEESDEEGVLVSVLESVVWSGAPYFGQNRELCSHLSRILSGN
jgi:hypothetical protein